MDSLAALLSKTELFGGLARDELEACAGLFHEVKFAKGQALFVRGEKEPPSNLKDEALLLAVIQGNSDFLRRATDEVLAYLLWLNRFAEAEKLTEND